MAGSEGREWKAHKWISRERNDDGKWVYNYGEQDYRQEVATPNGTVRIGAVVGNNSGVVPTNRYASIPVSANPTIGRAAKSSRSGIISTSGGSQSRKIGSYNTSIPEGSSTPIVGKAVPMNKASKALIGSKSPNMTELKQLADSNKARRTKDNRAQIGAKYTTEKIKQMAQEYLSNVMGSSVKMKSTSGSTRSTGNNYIMSIMQRMK